LTRGKPNRFHGQFLSPFLRTALKLLIRTNRISNFLAINQNEVMNPSPHQRRQQAKKHEYLLTADDIHEGLCLFEASFNGVRVEDGDKLVISAKNVCLGYPAAGFSQFNDGYCITDAEIVFTGLVSSYRELAPHIAGSTYGEVSQRIHDKKHDAQVEEKSQIFDLSGLSGYYHEGKLYSVRTWQIYAKEIFVRDLHVPK
jgi:hypothetical protein